jgi:hypothetical protein
MPLFGSSQKSSSQLSIPDWMKSQVQAIPGMADERILNRGTMSVDDMVAGLNPTFLAGLGGMGEWAGGTGGDILQQILGIGQQGAGAMGQGMDWLSQAAGRGPSMNMGPDMARVGEYANNPFMDSMVTAALRDPYRGLTEGALPASAMSQALTGNTGSTRGAIGDALLRRGYEDRASDVGAALRGGAWQSGLGVEASRASQNAGLDQNWTQILGQLGGMGIDAGSTAAGILGNANAMGLGNLQAMLQAGMTERAADQEFKNAGIYNFNQPMNDLLAYSGLLNPMATQYGKTTNKQTNSMGLGSAALAIGSTLMGMPTDFSGWGSGATPSSMPGYSAPGTGGFQPISNPFASWSP